MCFTVIISKHNKYLSHPVLLIFLLLHSPFSDNTVLYSSKLIFQANLIKTNRNNSKLKSFCLQQQLALRDTTLIETFAVCFQILYRLKEKYLG